MDKNSISIDLGDPRTGLVAEALSNKTCVKILNLLAEDELTASDIASRLDIPLNTTGYNLDKLIAAGLVEKTSNFFWSVKGKKTPVYRVANKKIIISPKRIMNRVVPAFLVFGALVAIALLLLFGNQNQNSNYTSTQSNELEKFNSYQEFTDYIEKANSESNNGMIRSLGGTAEMAASSSADSGSMAKSGSSGGPAGEYSQTNIQVEGVDELDIVKNDGKYIYTINQNKVSIVRAYPADDMELVSEIKFENYPNGLFILDNKLIVIESSYGYSYGLIEPAIAVDSEVSEKAAILPPTPSRPEVRVHVYDISSEVISEPKLIETFATDGNYLAARLIKDKLYLISNKYVNSGSIEIPYFRAGEDLKATEVTDIYYPSFINSNLLFTSVMAIDLTGLDYKGEVFLTGYSSTLYVSEDSIYITTPKTYDYNKVQEGVLKVLVDSYPSEIKQEALDIFNSDTDYYSKSEMLRVLLEKNYNKMTGDEKNEFNNLLRENYDDYYRQVSKEYEKTIIHRINLDNLDISYGNVGEVPGYILNQFSMDEKDGYLRIATTTGNSFGFGTSDSFNHLYILDDEFNIVGSVEDLAEGERIYSARFVGDKAYMVTFRQVDPLYVIDLTNPKNPEVLGYLKVTGFSNYLHPVKDNLLLGIGHEASEQGRAQGLKISLFDVSDFDNPLEVDKYVVKSDWSNSEAEYEHKAVLFDDKRDLLVIPVTYSQQTGQNWEYWQGAFAFNVADDDVSLKGKISHEIKNEQTENYYWNSQGYVKRSLFMDDNLYTVSDIMIKANDVNTLKDISSVKLNADYDYPVAYGYAK